MVNVIVSASGVQGPRGNAVLTGSGPPASSLGIDGDYYINTASYPASVVFYGPRANGAWPGTGVTITGVNGALLAANNLSDLANAVTARTNLGLGGAATLSVGTTTGTVAAGDDSRIAGAAQKSANLSDLANAATARTNLALGGSATLNVGTAAGTVAAGNDSRITGALQAANSLSDVGSASTARANLGLAAIVTAKSNLTAVAAPTAGADNTQGYSIGSIWVNTASSLAYVCGNASTGAAVWTPILPAGTAANTLAAGNDSRITGAIQSGASAGGDTTGTLPSSITVAKINGTSVPAAPATGQVLTATSSSSATWQSIGVPLKSGWYYPQDGGGGSLTMTYQLMWLWPFDCQRAITLAKLALNVKTAGPADAVIRMGVYSSDGAGGIGSLLIDALTVSAASTGVKTITVSQAAGPDRLWIAAVWQGTTTTGGPVVQAYAKASPYLGWSSYQQFPSVIAYQFPGIAGALPASLAAPTAFENNAAPGVQLAPA